MKKVTTNTQNNLDNELGHWELDPSCRKRQENDLGFVYMIQHEPTGIFYIGKKQLTRRVRLKPLKGKKRHRIVHKDSDWKKYEGSSKQLGIYLSSSKEGWTFTILKYCKSKSELAYEELKLQMQHDVLRNNKSLNGIINVRLSKIK